MRRTVVAAFALSMLAAACGETTAPDDNPTVHRLTLNDVVGVYQLETVNDNQIPYALPSGFQITGGTVELRANSVFIKSVQSTRSAGSFGDLSTWSGSFELILPDTIRFKPSGGFVPAALVEEFSGTIDGETLTVVESRSGLVDAGQHLMYRRS